MALHRKNSCAFSPQQVAYKYLWVLGVCAVSGVAKEIKAW